MRKATAQVAFSIPVILLVAVAIGRAGIQSGQRVGGVPLFAFCGILCFALNSILKWIYGADANTWRVYWRVLSWIVLNGLAAGVVMNGE